MHADFQYQARSASSGRRKLFFATILVLVILALNFASGGKVQSLAQNVASSVWRSGSQIGKNIGDIGFFSTRASLEAQISQLQQELAQEQLQTTAFSFVQQENASLSQTTHLAQTTPGITAPIASSLQSSPYGTFLVGAGSDDGVGDGSLVLLSDPQNVQDQNGFVVGKISEVNAHTSLVNELFAPGASVDVTIDGAGVVASGQGGENAQAEVPHGITVSVDDPVVAPEYGSREVGIVEHVASDPASAQSQIFISLPVSISSIGFVYITP